MSQKFLGLSIYSLESIFSTAFLTIETWHKLFLHSKNGICIGHSLAGTIGSFFHIKQKIQRKTTSGNCFFPYSTLNKRAICLQKWFSFSSIGRKLLFLLLNRLKPLPQSFRQKLHNSCFEMVTKLWSSHFKFLAEYHEPPRGSR